MKFYCSKCQNFLAFNTPHGSLFLVFGVPNAKYLAFGTLDENALKAFTTPKLLFHILKTLKNKKIKPTLSGTEDYNQTIKVGPCQFAKRFWELLLQGVKCQQRISTSFYQNWAISRAAKVLLNHWKVVSNCRLHEVSLLCKPLGAPCWSRGTEEARLAKR